MITSQQDDPEKCKFIFIDSKFYIPNSFLLKYLTQLQKGSITWTFAESR